MPIVNDVELSPCPLCGAKAFLSKDIVDGFFFGWSVGCPHACIGDKVHNLNDKRSFEKARIVMDWFTTKEQAVEAWERRCKE